MTGTQSLPRIAAHDRSSDRFHPCLLAVLADVLEGEDRRANRRISMTTAYWIAHPHRIAFISALAPEGVGQLLGAADDWPAGSYVIRVHRHEDVGAGDDERIWGVAVKDASGDVRIEPGGRDRTA